MLKISQTELSHLGWTDPRTVPVDDIYDSSVRRRYYNFWAIVRIGLHQRIGQALLSDSTIYEWLEAIEDELESFLTTESEGQIHMGATIKFGKGIPNAWVNRSHKGYLRLEGNDRLEEETRLNYWLSLFQNARSIASLLMKDDRTSNVRAAHDGRYDGNLKWCTKGALEVVRLI